ncbi:MAG: hypothetical protein KDE08_14280, partial [Rhodobacteraceae bacterium]|nr:hypothetical protein [Paracoccaceae bacterium]
MLRLIERLLGLTRLTLTENDRAILIRKGRIHAILGAGEHRIRARDMVEAHRLTEPELTSPFTEALIRERPDLVAEHLTEVRTRAGEVAVVERDGHLEAVHGPDARAHYWTVAGPFAVSRHDLADGIAVPEALGERLARARLTGLVTEVEVAEGHAGVMTRGGADPVVLRPGVHRFWAVGPRIAVKAVDLRLRTHEVTGHEVLTRDRVTIRVNLAADFRVADPLLAVTAVKDFEEALHRALGLAFRRTLGGLTLDALLADKAAVGAEAEASVRAEMAGIGIEVRAIALKDVVLPGEMRE